MAGFSVFSAPPRLRDEILLFPICAYLRKSAAKGFAFPITGSPDSHPCHQY